MTAHILFEAIGPNFPVTHSKIIIQELIRGEIGFAGFLCLMTSECVRLRDLCQRELIDGGRLRCRFALFGRSIRNAGDSSIRASIGIVLLTE